MLFTRDFGRDIGIAILCYTGLILTIGILLGKFVF